MIRPGMEGAHCLFAIPVAFDLEAVLIQAATAITVTQIVRIVVLKCLLVHLAIFLCGGPACPLAAYSMQMRACPQDVGRLKLPPFNGALTALGFMRAVLGFPLGSEVDSLILSLLAGNRTEVANGQSHHVKARTALSRRYPAESRRPVRRWMKTVAALAGTSFR